MFHTATVFNAFGLPCPTGYIPTGLKCTKESIRSTTKDPTMRTSNFPKEDEDFSLLKALGTDLTRTSSFPKWTFGLHLLWILSKAMHVNEPRHKA